MRKIQLPAIGGIRKVIKGDTPSQGTTITELGNGSITLAQLAALISQIQAQQQNTGGGNIGDGTEAVLVVGPGLSGGGPMLGTVRLNLTGPVPWGLDDGGGGGDGDPGPPGQAGVAGVNGATGGVGPAGPAIFLEAETGEDGLWAIPGPPGQSGVNGATGGIGPAGPAIFLEADSGQDGDVIPGPAGPTGAIGATGPQGPAGTGSGGGTGTLMFWVPEESYPDDITVNIPSSFGRATIQGPLAVLSTEFLSGNLSFDTITSRNITFLGPTPTIQATAAAAVLSIQTNATGKIQMGTSGGSATTLVLDSTGTCTISGGSGTAQQLLVNASSNVAAIIANAGNANTNANMIWNNQAATVQLMQLFGDGGLVIGKGTVKDMTTGTINVSGGYFLNGVPITQGATGDFFVTDDNSGDDQGFFRPVPTDVGPLKIIGPFQIASPTPAVAPGITALGTTTTITVITTVGGISLPALASTFWVVNVSGVQYGIPCFAL